MQKFYFENRYGSGDWPRHNYNYDYLLFRQDWGGQESLFFNEDEIDDVINKISEGEILIHMNYSLLYCKTKELLEKAEEFFGCYSLLMPPKT